MLEKFIPDIYSKSIFTINYESLKKKKIKCLIFDLDNTLAPVNIDKPNMKIKNLIFDLKEMGFHVILISNSPHKRVEPFKNGLEVDSIAFAVKPRKKSYNKVIETFDYKKEEIAAIGDQLITDVFGANRVGITSILVNPTSKVDGVSTKLFNRVLERHIMKKLTKKELFKIGKYYE